jgi:hypothetical protein
MRGIWLLLASAALGCAAVQVATQATPETDFSRFATYAHAPAAESDAAAAGEVRREIARVLEAKGYRAAPPERADLLVAFRLAGEERTRQKNAGDPDANYYVVQSYVEGTLAIDVFAAGRAEPVWVGSARSDALRESRAQEAVAGAVEAILETFPPTSSSAATGGS